MKLYKRAYVVIVESHYPIEKRKPNTIEVEIYDGTRMHARKLGLEYDSITRHGAYLSKHGLVRVRPGDYLVLGPLGYTREPKEDILSVYTSDASTSPLT